MTESSGRTVRSLFPSRLESLDDVLRNHGEAAPNVSGLASMAWGFLGEHVTDRIAGILDLDIFAVLAGAWCQVQALKASAEASLKTPGIPKIVALKEHKFTHVLHPEIEWTIDGIPIPKLVFDLQLKATVHSITLSIRDGHIVAVGGGNGSVALQLAYKGKNLHKELKSVDLAQLATIELRPPGLKVA